MRQPPTSISPQQNKTDKDVTVDCNTCEVELSRGRVDVEVPRAEVLPVDEVEQAGASHVLGNQRTGIHDIRELLEAGPGAAQLRAELPLQGDAVAERRRALARHVRRQPQHIDQNLEGARCLAQQLHRRRLTRQLEQDAGCFDLALRAPFKENLHGT